MSLFFVSDLHLNEHTIKLNTLFISWLNSLKNQASALYILGDLFEYWAGDDDESAFIYPIFNAIHQLSLHIPCYFIHGNRDFLFGKHSAQLAGLQILPDPSFIMFENQRFILTHGDHLCTDDLRYQQFRKTVRDEQWISNFLAKPLSERKSIIHNIRAQSEEYKGKTGLEIMDVNLHAVEQLHVSNQADFIIHGHTHQPKIHNTSLFQRIVLPDWRETQQGFLRVGPQGNIHLELGHLNF